MCLLYIYQNDGLLVSHLFWIQDPASSTLAILTRYSSSNYILNGEEKNLNTRLRISLVMSYKVFSEKYILWVYNSMVEYLFCKQEVISSNLFRGSHVGCSKGSFSGS